MTQPEKVVLAAFCCLAFLWVFRSPIQVGAFRIPGWSGLFPWPDFLDDATVSILIGVILCLLPAKGAGAGESPGPRFIMDWRTIEKGVPWGVVILFGGGFALAAGLQHSGLAAWIGSAMAGLQGTPLWLIFPLACAFAVVVTEMTSNVATVLMICPVLAEAAIELGINPYLVLIPATIMASFAFMLPVATPPNAVVFSSGWITIPAMFRAGFVLDGIAVLLLPAVVYLLGSVVFRF
jgi:sodium-dependent dicarboxylate transporter 2/3/5